MRTLDEARAEYFRAASLKDGTTCPCCDRFGKIYRISLNASLAHTLIYLYQHARVEFIHTPTHGNRRMLRSNNVGKLAYWGLAEAATQPQDPTKKRLGFWRITIAGVAWIEGRVRVFPDVVVYDDAVLETGGEPVTISQALKKPFNYTELMQAAP